MNVIPNLCDVLRGACLLRKPSCAPQSSLLKLLNFSPLYLSEATWRGVGGEVNLLTAADHGDVAVRPLGIRHTDVAASIAAGLGWRTPEVNLVEIVEAVGLAAIRPEQLIPIAGRRHGRHGAEPRRQIALQ